MMSVEPANENNSSSRHICMLPLHSQNCLRQTKKIVLRPMGLASIILIGVFTTVIVASSSPLQTGRREGQDRSVLNRLNINPEDYTEIGLAEGGVSDTKEMAQTTDSIKCDEPNPPIWPSSVKIFYPPQNDDEKQHILSIIQQTSDPISYDNSTAPYETYTSKRHFTNERHALLFHPGVYRGLDFEIGYYVQALGLGAKAGDVVFADCDKGPFVPSLERISVRPPWGLGLDTFWRVGENFKTEAREGMHWVVSQAAPLRRVHIAKKKTNPTEDDDKSGSLFLGFGDAYVSGGVLANAIVDGTTDFVGQQQWISRNVDFRGPAVGGAWSLVFVGCTGDQGNIPESSDGLDGRKSVTVDERPNVRVEKPYIAVKDDGISFVLRVPAPTYGEDAIGPDLDGAKDDVRDFSHVKVATPSDEEDTVVAAVQNSASLQEALDQGKDLVLSPGIYPLKTSLKVKYPNQVVLGLGLATLVAPTDGSPCIRVLPYTPGVRIAGIMLEASKQDVQQNYSDERDCPDGIASLLEWGNPNINDDRGSSTNPGVLTDIFARVGGSNPDRTVSTDVIMRIHSSNVVGDNLWLWRADHVNLQPGETANYPLNPSDEASKLPRVSDHYYQVMKDECKVATGLIVNGDDVTIHGLAVEHTEEHLTIWNGERGNVRFYQSELPYDVSHASFGAKGYTGYMVASHVKDHDAQAVGVYSNFRDYIVTVDTAIRHPIEETKGKEINVEEALLSGGKSDMVKDAFVVHLDNFGRIMSVVNGKGGEASEQGKPVRVAVGVDSLN
uniref:Pectate lyase superfamily protein domain-containing protein n=1 Tax=Ditylum brightwellii TaxID=49249 RepID=A0A7S1ZEA6_9STRA|mmetsp:Transcript_30118/g.44783  ORF Transcript_30118/g.44783 Transcript_30118/m.44783 type:complete len:781 (+) Transcript_30118:104-2446(+)